LTDFDKKWYAVSWMNQPYSAITLHLVIYLFKTVAKRYEQDTDIHVVLFQFVKTATLRFYRVVWRRYSGEVGYFYRTLWLVCPRHCISISIKIG